MERGHEQQTVGARPPMSLVGLDHVVIRAHDPAALARFYCAVLGCHLEKLQPELGLTQLRAGRSLIDLLDVASRMGQDRGAGPRRDGGSNMDHLCLRVDPFDGEAIRAYLQGCGCSPGEVVQRYGAEGEGPSLYLEDPEGNMIELKGPPSSRL